MNRLTVYALLVAGISLLFFGCSDKNSEEACQHQVTMDLDTGNYDAVLASGCAGAMQKGAAYFGKAGYDVKDVVNRFSEANDTGGSESDLNIYMTALISEVSDTTLTNLDSAKIEYSNIPATSENYQDAQFYTSLVDAMKSLSLMKSIVDGDGDGELNSSCDQNANHKADEIDAASCSLLVSAGQTCSTLDSGGSVTVAQDVPDLAFAGKSGTYRGLVVIVSGSGPSSTCPSSNEHKKLLFLQGSQWAAATTTGETCPDTSSNNSGAWPCPLEINNVPVDLVSAVDGALTSSIEALRTSLTTTTTTDVEQSINDIKSNNCCTAPEVWDPNNPASCACSSSELAAYLQTI
jgi:hypothetical protein